MPVGQRNTKLRLPPDNSPRASVISRHERRDKSIYRRIVRRCQTVALAQGFVAPTQGHGIRALRRSQRLGASQDI